MLTIQGLSLSRGIGSAAHRVRLAELHVGAGEVLAITGSSGCGKSTLLEGIGLLLAPEQVAHFSLAHHANVAELLNARANNALAAIRASDIGFVLQSGGLLPFLTVQENIMLPRALQRLPGKSRFVEHAIDVLGLAPLLKKKPSSLSIGERQRTAFVRALSHEPRLLLADEPTSALDPHTAERLFALFLGLVKELQIAALVVSHDWELIKRFGLSRLTPQVEQGCTVFTREPPVCTE